MLLGMPVNHTEDRIYITSMAANALLYIWRDGFKLSPDTQPAVRTIIQQLCGWLVNNTLSGKYKLYNGFFTLSRRNKYLVSGTFLIRCIKSLFTVTRMILSITLQTINVFLMAQLYLLTHIPLMRSVFIVLLA